MIPKSVRQPVNLCGSLKPGLKQVHDKNYNAITQLHRDNYWQFDNVYWKKCLNRVVFAHNKRTVLLSEDSAY